MKRAREDDKEDDDGGAPGSSKKARISRTKGRTSAQATTLKSVPCKWENLGPLDPIHHGAQKALIQMSRGVTLASLVARTVVMTQLERDGRVSRLVDDSNTFWRQTLNAVLSISKKTPLKTKRTKAYETKIVGMRLQEDTKQGMKKHYEECLAALEGIDRLGPAWCKNVVHVRM